MAAQQELSPEEIQRVDEICNSFVDAFIEGRQPNLEDHLGDTAEPMLSALLRELLILELEYRRASEETPEIDEYQTRFPDHAGLIEEAFRSPGSSGALRTLHEHTKAATVKAATGKASLAQRPESIGRYRVCGVLGRGEFGTVYLAEDERIRRRVAIKVARVRQFASEDAIAPFMEEAQRAAGPRHPGIVTIFDVGREEDGSCYIVMEYIEGRPLASLLDDESLAPQKAADLIAKIADAVHHAHKHGLVHRDLKPANILLDKDDQPHVADFGLALHEREQRDKFGEVSGTPAYMAPEQVRGEAHYLDGRTDVWAMGVLLYRALTHRYPFQGETLEELSEEIQTRQPRPPRMIDDSIPRELEAICLRCLSKRVEDRFLTAADLAGELRQAAGLPDPRETSGGSATSAAPAANPSQPPPPPSRPSSQRWAAWGLIGLLVVLLMVALRDRFPPDENREALLRSQVAKLVKEQLYEAACREMNANQATLEAPDAEELRQSVLRQWKSHAESLWRDNRFAETEAECQAILKYCSDDDITRMRRLAASSEPIPDEVHFNMTDAMETFAQGIARKLREQGRMEIAIGAFDGPGNDRWMKRILAEQFELASIRVSSSSLAWRISCDFHRTGESGSDTIAVIGTKLKDPAGRIVDRSVLHVIGPDALRLFAPPVEPGRTLAAAVKELAEQIAQELAEQIAQQLDGGDAKVTVGAFDGPGNGSLISLAVEKQLKETTARDKGGKPISVILAPGGAWRVSGDYHVEQFGAASWLVIEAKLKNRRGGVMAKFTATVTQQEDLQRILPEDWDLAAAP